MILLLSIVHGYPEWFWRMPVKEGAYFAVGYAPSSPYLSSAIAHAVKYAEIELSRSLGFEIVVEGESEATPYGDRWIDRKTEESVDTTRNIPYYVLDTAITDHMVLVLIGTEPGIAPLYQPPDHWWCRMPQEKEDVYSVGTAPVYFYETSSWKEAEAVARKNLAQSIFCNVKATWDIMGDAIEGRKIEKSHVFITSYQVVARHRENELYYVLIKGKGGRYVSAGDNR